jgi:hypothetical protein
MGAKQANAEFVMHRHLNMPTRIVQLISASIMAVVGCFVGELVQGLAW